MNSFHLPDDLDDADDSVEELLSGELKPILTTLNALVGHPGHRQHQAVVKAIQKVADPSSISALHQALQRGFAMYEYTCSDDDVIAKWFSWALFEIGTAESKAVLEEFALSENTLIANEMKYRLAKWL